MKDLHTYAIRRPISSFMSNGRILLLLYRIHSLFCTKLLHWYGAVWNECGNLYAKRQVKSFIRGPAFSASMRGAAAELRVVFSSTVGGGNFFGFLCTFRFSWFLQAFLLGRFLRVVLLLQPVLFCFTLLTGHLRSNKLFNLGVQLIRPLPLFFQCFWSCRCCPRAAVTSDCFVFSSFCSRCCSSCSEERTFSLLALPLPATFWWWSLYSAWFSSLRPLPPGILAQILHSPQWFPGWFSESTKNNLFCLTLCFNIPCMALA